MQECNQRNEKGVRHGYWEDYWRSDQLWFKGYYVNGIRHGYFESYYENGQLSYKGNYNGGQEIGYWIIGDQEYYYAKM